MSLNSDDLLEYDLSNCWHVYPSNEEKIHKLVGIDCQCNPRLEKQDNNGLLVIHNSFDGREYLLEKSKGVSN